MEIPYFEGDFWPNVIEETIKELDQEAKQKEASEKDLDVSVMVVGGLWGGLEVSSVLVLYYMLSVKKCLLVSWGPGGNGVHYIE